jgi:hypothetical protein
MDGVGDSDSVTTIVDGRTCNKGEWSIGAIDEDDVESGKGEEEIVNIGDLLVALFSIVLSRLGS